MSQTGEAMLTCPQLDGIAPVQSVAPSTEEECVAAVRNATTDRLAMIPVGGANALNQGNLLANPNWLAISTANLRGLAEYSPEDMVVTAGAGTTLAELQANLGKHGQFLPIATPRSHTATLGGIVAANAQGLWRPAFGAPRDRLLGVRVALADGSMIRGGGKVVKNVAGYDLCKLFAGSWGTLGLITEVTFKTNPVPPARQFVTYRGDDLERVLRAALEAHAARLDPAYMVAITQNGSVNLAVGMLGSEKAVNWQAEAIDEVLTKAGLARSESQMDEETLQNALVKESAPFKARLTVRPTDLPMAAAALSGRADLLVCHAQTGVIEAALNLPENASSSEFAQVRRSFAAAIGGRGHIVWTTVPARLKPGFDVWGTPRPNHAIMRKIKQTLDPRGMFSPGRFLGRI